MLAKHTYRHRAAQPAAALQLRYGPCKWDPTRVLWMLGLSITSSTGNGHATTSVRIEFYSSLQQAKDCLADCGCHADVWLSNVQRDDAVAFVGWNRSGHQALGYA